MAGLGDRFTISTRGKSHPAVPSPSPIRSLSTAVPQQLSRGLWWWEAGVCDGGRQRNAAGKLE